MRKKNFRLRINDIPIFRNEFYETKFMCLPYNHCIGGFETMFKEFGIWVAYNTKQT